MNAYHNALITGRGKITMSGIATVTEILVHPGWVTYKTSFGKWRTVPANQVTDILWEEPES